MVALAAVAALLAASAPAKAQGTDVGTRFLDSTRTPLAGQAGYADTGAFPELLSI